jgi:hypothetical protein
MGTGVRRGILILRKSTIDIESGLSDLFLYV